MTARSHRTTTLALALLAFTPLPAVAARRELALRRAAIEVPAPPASLIPADLNEDGLLDLVAVVPFIAWGGVSFDRVEDAVQVTEVVPALFDRREIHAWLATPDGGYAEAARPLDVPRQVLALAAGNAAVPVVALTDAGVSALRLRPGAEGRAALALEDLLAEPSLLAGSGTLLPELEFVKDADGDGIPDLILPVRDGLAIHRGTTAGFDAEAAFRGTLPGDTAARGYRGLPWPAFADLDGDGRRDMLVTCTRCSPQSLHVLAGLGGCRFGAPVELRTGCLGLGAAAAPAGSKAGEQERRVVFFGDLDGDGRGDVVTRQGIDTGKSDLKQAKRPRSSYRFHRVGPDLSLDAEPRQLLEIEGYASSGNFDDAADPDFKDLDGDGRKDLITVSLDFSMVQALRAMTTKKIGLDLEFRTWCASTDGGLRPVGDQVLTEKLRFDLNQLEIGRLAQFRGDFDGDGTVDFLRLGRGNSIAIHRGKAGCRYAADPDLTIPLDAEIENVGLVRVADLDGDGASDVAITRLLAPPDEQVSTPVRIDLLLSGGRR